MKGIGIWLPLIGYLFVAVVAIIAALRIENLPLMILLFISAIVSLILAITRLLSAKRMGERIKYLEDNHLSLSYNKEEEKITVKMGI